jgi:soluble lytic murein transglycosylase-like protein
VAQQTDLAPVKSPVVPANCNAVDGYSWNVQTAYAICMAESRGDPNAVDYNQNGTVDRGLMQVNSIHADMVGGDLTSLLDPSINIKVAYALSKHGTDWTAWSTYNNGEYRKWL